MSDLVLLDCRPLSARISARACEMNRKRGLIACERCDGLTGSGETQVQQQQAVPKKRGRAATTLPVDRRNAIRLTFVGEGAAVVRAMQELIMRDGTGPLEDLLVDAMKLQLKQEQVIW